MTEKIFNVLFLCTGNSARSILDEAILNRLGRGRFQGYSAGSHPRGKVHPMSLQLLQSFNYMTDDLRSKSWDEFARPDAPQMDFIFTVCDSASREVCPVWPGRPMTSHWRLEDPAAFAGSEEESLRKFREIYFHLEHRLQKFVNLPLASLDPKSLQDRLEDIGTRTSPTEKI